MQALKFGPKRPGNFSRLIRSLISRLIFLAALTAFQARTDDDVQEREVQRHYHPTAPGSRLGLRVSMLDAPIFTLYSSVSLAFQLGDGRRRSISIIVALLVAL